jgi:hypothetical protein
MPSYWWGQEFNLHTEGVDDTLHYFVTVALWRRWRNKKEHFRVRYFSTVAMQHIFEQ